MKETKFKRKCSGCNSIKSKDDLIKITCKKSTGEIVINPDNSFFGRSVYICKDLNCVLAALKKDKLFKLLKTKPNETIKEKIRAVLEK